MRPAPRPNHPRGGCLANILLLLAAVCLVAAIVAGFLARSGVAELETLAKGFKDGSIPTERMLAPGTKTIEMKEGLLGIVAISDDEIDGTAYPISGPVNATVTVTDADGTPLRFESFAKANPQGGVIETPDFKLELIGFAEIKKEGSYTVKVEREGEPVAFRLGQLSQASLEAFVRGIAKAGGGVLGLFCGGGGFILFGLIGGILWLFGRKKPAA